MSESTDPRDRLEAELISTLETDDLKELINALHVLKEMGRAHPGQDLRRFAENEKESREWFRSDHGTKTPISIARLGSFRGQEVVTVLQWQVREPYRPGMEARARKQLKQYFDGLIPPKVGRPVKYTAHERQRDEKFFALHGLLETALKQSASG